MPDDHASSTRAVADRLTASGENAARRVRVLLPLPLPEALDYLAPEGHVAAASPAASCGSRSGSAVWSASSGTGRATSFRRSG